MTMPFDDDTKAASREFVSGLDANAERWRGFSREIDELEVALASARWPQQMVRGLTNVVAEQIKESEGILDLFDHVAGQVEPDQLVPFPQRERDIWLWAAIHLSVARTAEKVMWQAAGQRFPENEDERHAICQAFLAIWRLAPILSGLVMSDFPDEFAKGRASLVLSSWLATRVKSGGAGGQTTELHLALTEGGAEFWPSLLERLPGAVVTAWFELQESGRTPTPRVLLNRATYLLKCEGPQKRVRAGGADYLVTPESLPDDHGALSENDEA
jgi:hypothetical protein